MQRERIFLYKINVFIIKKYLEFLNYNILFCYFFLI